MSKKYKQLDDTQLHVVTKFCYLAVVKHLVAEFHYVNSVRIKTVKPVYTVKGLLKAFTASVDFDVKPFELMGHYGTNSVVSGPNTLSLVMSFSPQDLMTQQEYTELFDTYYPKDNAMYNAHDQD